MAKVIKVKSKDQTKNSYTGGMTWSLALGLFDNSVTPNVELNANFKQTETLTGALAGITDYGALYVSDVISDITATVDIVCVDDSGEEITKSATLQSILNHGAGGAI